MNIFYLDEDLDKCVQYHCDKHVVKMILEYAQILCTAHRELDGDNNNKDLYKSTHKNHPSCIWARLSSSNYFYLYKLFISLCNEYTHRYGKVHTTYSKLNRLLSIIPNNIPNDLFTKPPQCMPDEFKCDDTVKAYRNYYISKQNNFDLNYKNRNIPIWLTTKKKGI